MTNTYQVLAPDIGDFKDIDVIELLVEPGAMVSEGQGLIVVETDKTSMEVPSPSSGVLKSFLIGLGDKISRGTPIAEMQNDAVTDEMPTARAEVSAPTSESQPERIPEPAAVSPASKGDTGEAFYAAPSLRKLARNLNVDLSLVRGSGTRGRILEEDLVAHIKLQAVPTAAVAGAGLPDLASWPQVDFARYGVIERQALSRIS